MTNTDFIQKCREAVASPSAPVMRHWAMTSDDLERHVTHFGEAWRPLITDALTFLDAHEPTWRLAWPIDRRGYLRHLIAQASPPQEG